MLVVARRARREHQQPRRAERRGGNFADAARAELAGLLAAELRRIRLALPDART